MTARRPQRRRLDDVVAAGNTLESLEAIRDQIARDIESCESMRDKAALYLRLADVIGSIQTMRPAAAEGDSVDEIAARRAARRAGAAKRSPRARRSAK